MGFSDDEGDWGNEATEVTSSNDERLRNEDLDLITTLLEIRWVGFIYAWHSFTVSR